MKKIVLFSIISMGLFGGLFSFFGFTDKYDEPCTASSIYEIEVKTIKGEKIKLEQYKGKTLLIVNTASKCGLTPQYKDLQLLYDQYKDQNLVILGFPANNFLFQEPGSDSQIETFCSANYGVTFPMFSKISVKGNDMHPLYQFLTHKKLNKVLDSSVKWNFQKFLVNKEGTLLSAVAPNTKVTDESFLTQLKNAL